MAITDEGYRFVNGALIEQNEQLRALLTRSIPLMRSMCHTIEAEYNHCDEEYEVDEVVERAKALGIEVNA